MIFIRFDSVKEYKTKTQKSRRIKILFFISHETTIILHIFIYNRFFNNFYQKRRQKPLIFFNKHIYNKTPVFAGLFSVFTHFQYVIFYFT